MIEESRVALANRLNALLIRFSSYKDVSVQMLDLMEKTALVLRTPISAQELDTLLTAFGCSDKSRRDISLRATMQATKYNSGLFFRYARAHYGKEVDIKDQPVFVVPYELFVDLNAFIRDYISLTFKAIALESNEELIYRKANCLRRDIIRFNRICEFHETNIEQLDWSSIVVQPSEFLVDDYDLSYLDEQIKDPSPYKETDTYFLGAVDYRLNAFLTAITMRVKFIERIAQFGLSLTTA